MTNLLLEDALRVAEELEPANDEQKWILAAYYLAGQFEIALRDTSAGFSRLPPQRPTRALKIDKDGPTLAVSKY